MSILHVRKKWIEEREGLGGVGGKSQEAECMDYNEDKVEITFVSVLDAYRGVLTVTLV